jgi:acyl-CoA synthetase (AMP-forming)/AMP-acid ligase II
MLELTPLSLAGATVNALVAHWAQQQPDADAFIFLGAENLEKERLTFAQVANASRGLARVLRAQAMPASRVLLMFEPGLAFTIAFFACHYVGMVPVPVVPIRKGRMREAAVTVARDCLPSLLLCTLGHAGFAREALAVESTLRTLHITEVDINAVLDTGTFGDDPPAVEAPLAFLQYTSGSTSSPKGVLVTQTNLFANLEMQRLAMRNPWGTSYVGWAPLYHDMGLIANMLEPFYLGGRCVLMASAQMAQAPWLWLRAVSDYQAHTSGGSNFAYELCLQRAARILAQPLDLSCWKVAFNSAEPVRADTIERFCATFAAAGFVRHAMYPCFGLAEATLLVSGGGDAPRPVVRSVSKSLLEHGMVAPPVVTDDARQLVGCGAAMEGEDIAIVDPDTGHAQPPGRIGEIWVRGPHIPFGYWNNPTASAETFHGVLHGDSRHVSHLRTGDLGFLDAGELYVTGRLKDLLIVRGRNLYPQDIERTAQEAHPGLGAAAVFPLDANRIGLIIEIERQHRHDLDPLQVAAAVRQAIMQEFEISLHVLHFVATGSVPVTSSGKVRRKEAQSRFVANAFDKLGTAAQNQQLLIAG